MKETFRECLKDYAGTMPAPGTRHVNESRRPMADFCGVNIRTAERWLIAGNLPIGEPLIRLLFFLELVGYEVFELKRLERTIYRLGEMISYNVLSVQEVVGMLSYEKSSSAYRPILKGLSTTHQRSDKINTAWKSHKDEINSRREVWLSRLGKTSQTKHTSSATTPSSVRKQTGERHISLGRDPELETLGYLVLAALPLAEKIVSDEFTAEDRRNLRKMTGGDNIFRLSNALNALCGETARKQVIGNSQKKEDTRRGV